MTAHGRAGRVGDEHAGDAVLAAEPADEEPQAVEVALEHRVLERAADAHDLARVVQRPKAEVARQHVAEVNAAVEVVAHVVRVDEEQMVELLQGAQVVVDALDALPTRLALQRAARRLVAAVKPLGKRGLAIFLHDSPDPDSISSAVASRMPSRAPRLTSSRPRSGTEAAIRYARAGTKRHNGHNSHSQRCQ